MRMAHLARARARHGLTRRWSFGGEQPTASAALHGARILPNLSEGSQAGRSNLDERLSTAAYLAVARKRLHWQAMQLDESYVPVPGADGAGASEAAGAGALSEPSGPGYVVTEATRNEWKRNVRRGSVETSSCQGGLPAVPPRSKSICKSASPTQTSKSAGRRGSLFTSLFGVEGAHQAQQAHDSSLFSVDNVSPPVRTTVEASSPSSGPKKKKGLSWGAFEA